MNNTELCERLLAVQKELNTLEKYVEQHLMNVSMISTPTDSKKARR